MSAFWHWAQSILAGDWLGKEIYHQAPLYPYLLAVVLAVKNSPTFAIGAQLLLIRLAEKAYAGGPDYKVVFYNNLGLIYRRLGDKKKADEYFRRYCVAIGSC